MDVFKLNAETRGYVFCPPHPGMDKKGVFAVTGGSCSYLVESASVPQSSGVTGSFSREFIAL